jgi:hypothetical protein
VSTRMSRRKSWYASEPNIEHMLEYLDESFDCKSYRMELSSRTIDDWARYRVASSRWIPCRRFEGCSKSPEIRCDRCREGAAWFESGPVKRERVC